MELKKSPLVTIALPVFNNGYTIADCIRSILKQTYSDWELIVINDGSTDNTQNILDSISDKRVKVLNDGKNKGLIARLNQIIDISNGEFIARMDGDDLMHPERIANQVNLLLNDQSVHIVDTAVVSIDGCNRVIGKRGTSMIKKDKVTFLSSNKITHPSVMYRRNWALLNKYDPRFLRAEDYELWCRSFLTAKFRRITEPLLYLREGNINVSNYVLTCKTNRRIFKKYALLHLGKINTMNLIAKSFLKEFVYRVFGFLRIQYILTKQRSSKLTRSEEEYHVAILESIFETDLN